eukprot:TRINITY_DN8905_c0_g2_i3.p1 TRINITY_DN8905_c0_g2~~TRINITY_DN8905_c0_g2_i3.p1  ORF type:complete len:911 (-),score=150.00 TRINITY_DN8905_c0_g2_i3:2999-5731(-)
MGGALCGSAKSSIVANPSAPPQRPLPSVVGDRPLQSRSVASENVATESKTPSRAMTDTNSYEIGLPNSAVKLTPIQMAEIGQDGRDSEAQNQHIRNLSSTNPEALPQKASNQMIADPQSPNSMKPIEIPLISNPQPVFSEARKISTEPAAISDPPPVFEKTVHQSGALISESPAWQHPYNATYVERARRELSLLDERIRKIVQLDFGSIGSSTLISVLDQFLSLDIMPAIQQLSNAQITDGGEMESSIATGSDIRKESDRISRYMSACRNIVAHSLGLLSLKDEKRDYQVLFTNPSWRSVAEVITTTMRFPATESVFDSPSQPLHRSPRAIIILDCGDFHRLGSGFTAGGCEIVRVSINSDGEMDSVSLSEAIQSVKSNESPKLSLKFLNSTVDPHAKELHVRPPVFLVTTLFSVITGHRRDLNRYRSACNAHGIFMLVDCTQLPAHSTYGGLSSFHGSVDGFDSFGAEILVTGGEGFHGVHGSAFAVAIHEKTQYLVRDGGKSPTPSCHDGAESPQIPDLGSLKSESMHDPPRQIPTSPKSKSLETVKTGSATHRISIPADGFGGIELFGLYACERDSVSFDMCFRTAMGFLCDGWIPKSPEAISIVLDIWNLTTPVNEPKDHTSNHPNSHPQEDNPVSAPVIKDTKETDSDGQSHLIQKQTTFSQSSPDLMLDNSTSNTRQKHLPKSPSFPDTKWAVSVLERFELQWALMQKCSSYILQDIAKELRKCTNIHLLDVDSITTGDARAVNDSSSGDLILRTNNPSRHEEPLHSKQSSKDNESQPFQISKYSTVSDYNLVDGLCFVITSNANSPDLGVDGDVVPADLVAAALRDIHGIGIVARKPGSDSLEGLDHYLRSGWCCIRVGLSSMVTAGDVSRLLEALKEIAEAGSDLRTKYKRDPQKGWIPLTV